MMDLARGKYEHKAVLVAAIAGTKLLVGIALFAASGG
jgi:hypothetical protein